MAGVNGVKSNPYLAKLMGIFSRVSDPADQAQTNDMSSFLQELESQHNPSSQVNPAKSSPVGGRTNPEPGAAKSHRMTMDTLEISEEAYEAYRNMKKGVANEPQGNPGLERQKA